MSCSRLRLRAGERVRRGPAAGWSAGAAASDRRRVPPAGDRNGSVAICRQTARFPGPDVAARRGVHPSV